MITQKFTHDMLRDFRKVAPVVFKDLVGKPCRFLEVGIFEGNAACWVMDHILTHPESCYLGVEALPERCRITRRNLGPYHWNRWDVIQGDSAEVLPDLLGLGNRFDGIYVDADHRYEPARVDVFNAWNLLAPGGVMLVDDYLLEASSLDPTVKFGVRQAVDELVASLTPGEYRVVLPEDNYQFAIQKVQVVND